jgi:hypothetical protein
MKCSLLPEQRNIIITAIKEGKEEFSEYMKFLPETVTKTAPPRFLYDLVNTKVVESVKSNSHMKMVVISRKAGFHPYIVIHDTVRNIFILVSKLPSNKYIFGTSRYRGEYSASNFDRLFDMGATEDEIASGIEYQPSLNLSGDTQPFTIIVIYDGVKDVVFEGALRPDQEDWIYKQDITQEIIADMANVVPMRIYDSNQMDLPIKTTQDDIDDIVIKLKDN